MNDCSSVRSLPAFAVGAITASTATTASAAMSRQTRRASAERLVAIGLSGYACPFISGLSFSEF